MPHSPEYIEDDIERTRLRIEAKLNRLGDEISPNRILRSAFGANGHSTTDLLEAIAAKARENPVSALLIGAGIAGIVLKSGRDRSENDEFATAGHVNELNHAGKSSDLADRIAQNAALLKNKAGNLRDGVEDSAAGIRTRLEEETQELKDLTAQTGANVKEYAKSSIEAVEKAASNVRSQSLAMARDTERHLHSAGRHIGDQVQRTRERADVATEWVKENPVPAGLMALAFGAAAASLLSARKSGNSEDASEYSEERLKENARREGGDPNTRGADRFQELQDKAALKQSTPDQQARKKVSGKKPKPKEQTASSAPAEPTSASEKSGGQKRPSLRPSAGKSASGKSAETEKSGS